MEKKPDLPRKFDDVGNYLIRFCLRSALFRRLSCPHASFSMANECVNFATCKILPPTCATPNKASNGGGTITAPKRVAVFKTETANEAPLIPPWTRTHEARG